MTLPYLSPLDNETSKAYAAYCVYRDLGVGRSLEDACIKGVPNAYRSTTVWRNWSVKYHWVERCKLYDAYIADKHRQQREAAHLAELEEYRSQLAQSSKATLSAGRIMLKLALEKLAEMEEKKEKPTQAMLTAFVNTANNTITSAMDGWGMALTIDDLLPLLERDDNQAA